MPWLSTAMVSTPTTMLLIFPPPPPILTPPSMAPAMTVNSAPMPMEFAAEPIRPMLTVWATPKKMPATAKIRIRIFATLTPDRATASGLEPRA